MHNLADDLSRATNLMSPLPSCESSEKGKGAMVKERHYYGKISDKSDNAVNYLAEPSVIDAQEEEDEEDEEDAVRLFAQQGNAEVMLKELEGEIPLEVILNIQNIHNDFRGHLGADKTFDAYKLEYGVVNDLKHIILRNI